MSFQRLPLRSLATDKSSLLSAVLSSKVGTSLCLAGTAVLFATTAAAQLLAGAHAQVLQLVDKDAANWRHVSKQIWDFAELGYHETRSSALLQQQLEAAGFKVRSGVADEPTAFIASYGEGKPVVAILGEFDALPGLSQQTVPTRDPVKADAPGHGCGHNLLGAGAALAAVALKQYMEAHHIAGTLRYYGTPAEEGGSGKVYMVRDGAFKNVDVVLHWHPGDSNAVDNGGELAMVSAKFTFSWRGGTRGHGSAARSLGARRRHADGQRRGVHARARSQPHAHSLHHLEGRGGAERGAGPGADGPDRPEPVQYHAERRVGVDPEHRQRRNTYDRHHAGCERHRQLRQHRAQ